MQSQPFFHLNNLLLSVDSRKLEQQCSDEDLARISDMIVRWESFSPYMSIGEVEEEEIRFDNPMHYKQQKLVCLRKWRAKHGKNATYKHLIEIFFKAGHIDLCHKIVTMLDYTMKLDVVLPQPSYSTALVSADTSSELRKYHTYLVDQYHDEPPPGTAEFPFNPARDFEYIELSLVEKKRNETRRVNMEHILTFKDGERKVTLLKGPAGSGKSTVMWELKRRWASGELFSDIQFLICINLRNPQYHMAKDLVDIIPCPDDDLKKSVALCIKKRFGAGDGFFFDGWDEIPYKYQRRSYIYNLVAGKIGHSLPRAKFLVTSRSIGSTIVRGISPKHLEIQPFSPQQISAYFTRYTNLCIADVEDYAKHNKQFFQMCDLPLNASLVSCTLQDPRFKKDKPFPETQSQLYRSLTIYLLLSEAERRSDDLDDPEELPDSSKLFFTKLSSLAYQGFQENKSVFFKEDLLLHKIDMSNTGVDHTRGLMMANPTFTIFGLSKSYTFRHLTFQEYLAAYFLSNQPIEEQCGVLKTVLEKHPHQKQFFGFYAGITGLKNQDIISIFNEMWLHFLRSNDSASKREPMFHLIMKCVLESQSEHLLCIFHDSITVLDVKGFHLGCQDLVALAKISAIRPHPVQPIILDMTLCTFDRGALVSFVKELKTFEFNSASLCVRLDNKGLLFEDYDAFVDLKHCSTVL